MKKNISSVCNYLVVFSLLFLIACSSNSSKTKYGSKKAPSVYYIKRGDTLFSIAWKYGLDAKTIQRRNNISNPNKILVGQKLRLKSSGYASTSGSAWNKKKSKWEKSTSKYSRKVVKKGNWSWPLRGKIVRRFNPGRIGANGIRLAGKPNQTINAAEGGRVAYKGNGLSGYGNVIIIKHSNGLLSAYGFLNKTFVKEGQRVKKKQKIGTVGYASNKKHLLHFEVRKKGKPVNPLSYIGTTYRY